MDINIVALSNNIFIARKKAKMNQKQLSKITGLSSTYISMLENNAHDIEPSLDTLSKIAEATNTTLDELLFENLIALNPTTKPEDIQGINAQLYSMNLENLKLIIPFIKAYTKVKNIKL